MEQVLIKSKKHSPAIVLTIMIGISLSILVFYWLLCMVMFGDYSMDEFLYTDGAAFIPKILSPLCFILIFWALYFTSITVTDKRVYGQTMFGRRVDLPLDSITSVGFSAFHGICVATASGYISFALVANNREIHYCISQLLIQRQEKYAYQPQPNQMAQLRELKELLDTGIITQEDFEAKKRQILGI